MTHMLNTRSATPSRAARYAYWACTILIALLMLQGGIVDLMRTDSAMEVMKFLGYPAYFTVLLGVAKVLGAIAILAPVPRVLREWAYAGFTFDTIAAIISLAAVGVVNWTLMIPGLALAFVLCSYVLWRRRLPAFDARTSHLGPTRMTGVTA
jgi:hypothetical protein